MQAAYHQSPLNPGIRIDGKNLSAEIGYFFVSAYDDADSGAVHEARILSLIHI